ncbi:MAG: putative metal-binding motif-containing protein [Deltaproteobacteria bacterium]|nr:putative metal-binding motif-containing protein [Deltaproteobacteria bacterium]
MKQPVRSLFFLLPLLCFFLYWTGCDGSKEETKPEDKKEEKKGDETTPPPGTQQPGNGTQQAFQYFADKDGDGFGDPLSPLDSKEGTPPAGYVANKTDCNDNDKTVNPGSTKWENDDGFKDFNCDGVYYWLPLKKTEFHQQVGLFNGRSVYANGVVETTWDQERRLLTSIGKIVIPLRQGPPVPALSSRVTGSLESLYNNKGGILTYKEHEKGLNSPVTSSREWTYDDKGNKLTYKEHSGDLNSSLTSSSEWTYDDKGNKLTYKEHSGDLASPVTCGDLASPVTYSREWTYDDKGRPLTHKWHSGDLASPVTYSREWTYDDKGKPLTYKGHGGDLNSQVTILEEDYTPIQQPLSLDDSL